MRIIRIQLLALYALMNMACQAQTINLTPPTIGAFNLDSNNNLISIGIGTDSRFIAATRRGKSDLYASAYFMLVKQTVANHRKDDAIDLSDVYTPDRVNNFKQTGQVYGLRVAFRPGSGEYHAFEASCGISRQSTNYKYDLSTQDWDVFSGDPNEQLHSVEVAAVEHYADITLLAHANDKKEIFDFYLGFSLGAGQYEVLKVKDSRLDSGPWDVSGYTTPGSNFISGLDINHGRFFGGVQFKHSREKKVLLDEKGKPTSDPDSYGLKAASSNLSLRVGIAI